ncbi:BatD family protein [Methylobrevis albus]|uniref:BatD family protein n=1 Tax=Methylobrevis albus TaxID=2793297 RepID=A0A931N0J1_9HYPH|nr:BatD family protein [Methylobrevis albus]MBH0239259.1 BatD family protein [Methylobrevis albus]
MVTHRFAAWFAALVIMLVAAPAQAVDVAGARLWVDVDHGAHGPYPQQMVLLRVRGAFTIPITLERLQHPAFAGFRALQLGRDHWFDTVDRGRQARGFERVVAVYPQKSGRLTIAPFVHQITTVGPDGKRFPVEIASPPVEIDVLPAPAAGWWLPAHDVTVDEQWSVDPDGMAIGQSTRRIVTIRAEGVLADQMPPQPDVKAPGLIVFTTPVERKTVLSIEERDVGTELRRQALKRPGRLEEVTGRNGPVATVTYTWAVQPQNSDPSTLPPLEFNWFDTDAGEIRTVVLPARRVAWAETGPSLEELEAAIGMAPAAAPSSGGVLSAAIGLAAFLASAAATSAALAAGGLRGQGGPLGRLTARIDGAFAAAALRRAAGRGDGPATFRALDRLRSADHRSGRRGAAWSDPAVVAAVGAVEAAVFGPPRPGTPLATAAAALLRARRSAGRIRREAAQVAARPV